MKDDPLEAVYAYVERAYVRVQAGDILIRCLEQGDMGPMQQMVEGLVVAGPQNLGVLREMLAESEQRKVQLLDDLQQVFSELEKNLKSYGVPLVGIKNAVGVINLSTTNFLALLREAGVEDDDKQVMCVKLLRDSRELMLSLMEHIRLMEDIGRYLQDWLWGLAYQSARQNVQSDDAAASEQAL